LLAEKAQLSVWASSHMQLQNILQKEGKHSYCILKMFVKKEVVWISG